MSMNLKVGDKVVHRSHGMGTVKGIEEREFTAGVKNTFYILEILDRGYPKKVFVPVDSAAIRLRALMDLTTLGHVYRILSGTAPVPEQTWNRRYREYMEKVHSGEPLAVAEVVRDLRALRDVQDLSFGERSLFEQAERLLRDEVEAIGEVLP